MFIETPATARSYRMRKPVYGAGINDLNYIVFKTGENGKGTHCPYYQRWKNMMERCYSKHYKARWPTYLDVTCCEEWITASNFKRWMKQQNWQGMVLDKDILIDGNKLYAPDRCVFIPPELNKLLNFNNAQRGVYGIGIREFKGGKYRAVIRDGSRSVSLGSYASQELAQAAYISAKKDLVRKAASTYAHIHKDIEQRLNEIADNLSLDNL